jgi:hypothetical protein
MHIISSPISKSELLQMAQNSFGNMVKGVVDINKKIIAVDAPLHSDEESLLLSQGSKQSDIWGINLYPEITGEDFLEFDSMINLRPSFGNMSRGVDDPNIRNLIQKIVSDLIT